MAQKRFNYTGRKTITRNDQFSAAKHPHPKRGTRLDLMITLHDDLVKDCSGSELYLDLMISGGTGYRRFKLGEIDEGSWEESIDLTDVDPDDQLVLTIKAVDQHTKVILASSKPVSPESPDPSRPPGEAQARSLLGLRKGPLDGVVYKVEFSEDEGPIVYLNEKLDDASSAGIVAFARTSPLFTSVVWPSVLKEVLTYYLDNGDPMDVVAEPDSLSAKWHAFARRLTGEEGPDFEKELDREEIRKWIDDVVAAFASSPGVAAVETFANAVRGA